jgi:hypothetical protein
MKINCNYKVDWNNYYSIVFVGREKIKYNIMLSFVKLKYYDVYDGYHNILY